jgi:hypothetical protein
VIIYGDDKNCYAFSVLIYVGSMARLIKGTMGMIVLYTVCHTIGPPDQKYLSFVFNWFHAITAIILIVGLAIEVPNDLMCNHDKEDTIIVLRNVNSFVLGAFYACLVVPMTAATIFSLALGSKILLRFYSDKKLPVHMQILFVRSLLYCMMFSFSGSSCVAYMVCVWLGKHNTAVLSCMGTCCCGIGMVFAFSYFYNPPESPHSPNPHVVAIHDGSANENTFTSFYEPSWRRAEGLRNSSQSEVLLVPRGSQNSGSFIA